VEVGLHVISACRAQAPEQFQFLSTSWEGHPPHFDLLAGGPALRTGLLAGESIAALADAWAGELAAFADQRRRYLIYG
jgi:uncharacterized protein YbbC (DUF1343 family)